MSVKLNLSAAAKKRKAKQAKLAASSAAQLLGAADEASSDGPTEYIDGLAGGEVESLGKEDEEKGPLVIPCTRQNWSDGGGRAEGAATAAGSSGDEAGTRQ